MIHIGMTRFRNTWRMMAFTMSPCCCEKEPDEGLEQNPAYVQVVKRFEKNSLDFVLVDGMYRDAYANWFVRIRPGGLLIIDNANWYLPSNSGSPNSRTFVRGQLPSSG